MKVRLFSLSLAITVLSSACTGRGSDASLTPLRPDETAHHYAASISPADSLSVGIGGRILVQTPSSQRYSAGISNGTATRYYYQWFTADCTPDNCATTPMSAFAEGEGLYSVYIPFASTNDEKDITVHITELDGSGRSGSKRIEVEGPNLVSNGGGLVGIPCDFYNDIFYPLTGSYTDPFTGVSRQRNFRRNYCGNAISWDPST